jgi:hypothetical protein
MLNYLTTSDIAKAAKKTRQQIWNLWMDRKLPAELLNPGGSRLRFIEDAGYRGMVPKGS